MVIFPSLLPLSWANLQYFVGFLTHVKQQLLANETIHAMLNLCRQNPWIKN